MALFTNIDGVQIQMTPDEESATLAAWAAEDARVASLLNTPQYPTMDEHAAALYARDILNDGGVALAALQSQATAAVSAEAAVPVEVSTLQTEITPSKSLQPSVA